MRMIMPILILFKDNGNKIVRSPACLTDVDEIRTVWEGLGGLSVDID